jgi:NAD(P)-dependent dehydrogenase (short-subunit alcohol dehydrogenase family)
VLVDLSMAHRAGRSDILSTNVGAVSPRLTRLRNLTDEQGLTSITLSLMAAGRTTRVAQPIMLAVGRGTMVTTSFKAP